MSYDQLAAAVDRLGVSNGELTEQSLLTQRTADAARVIAEDKASVASAAAASAASSKDSASASAASALVSKNSAATSASTATSETTKAVNSASAALASQSAAKTSETNAKASEVAAAPAIAAGLRFCGVSATAPTTRTNGTALQQADEYHNSVDKLRYTWTGAAWVALNSSAAVLESRLADSTYGARMSAYQRGVLGSSLGTLQGINDASVRNIWEWANLVTSKPTLSDPGTWDWTPAFTAAVLASRSAALYVPAGYYRITKTSGDLLILNDIKIFGDGRKKTKLQMIMPVGVLNALNIAGSFVTLQDFSCELFGVSSSQVGMRFSASSEQHRFIGFELDGTASAASATENFVHGITVSPTASVSDVIFQWASIHHCRYGMFTPNNQSGVLRDWIWSICEFHHNSQDDLEFNAIDNLADTWVDCAVVQCVFRDWGGTGNVAFAIGIDSGKRMRIQGNRFFGPYPAAIHIEDHLQDILVTGNIIQGARRGIEVYQSNAQSVLISDNIIIGPANWALDINPSTLPEPTSVDSDSVGIYVLTPGVGSTGTCTKISGNIVRGCVWGIVGPVDRGGEVVDNIVGSCVVGIHRNEGADRASKRIRNNSIYHCKYAFGVASALTVGLHTIEGCLNLFRGTAGVSIIHFANGLDIGIPVVAVAGSANTQIPLFAMPSNMTIYGGSLVHNGPGSSNSFAGVTATWDGVTLTSTRQNQTSVGAANISGTPLSNVGGNLCMTVYNAGGAGNASVNVSLSGNLTFRL